MFFNVPFQGREILDFPNAEIGIHYLRLLFDSILIALSAIEDIFGSFLGRGAFNLSWRGSEIIWTSIVLFIKPGEHLFNCWVPQSCILDERRLLWSLDSALAARMTRLDLLLEPSFNSTFWTHRHKYGLRLANCKLTLKLLIFILNLLPCRFFKGEIWPDLVGPRAEILVDIFNTTICILAFS